MEASVPQAAPGEIEKYLFEGRTLDVEAGDGGAFRGQPIQLGQRVSRGDVVGRVGSTGRSTFSHLHYEIEQHGERVDPLRFVLAD